MDKIFAWRRLLAGLLAAFAFVARAGNPLVPGIGLTDGHGVVFGDRVFLYATHDVTPNSKKFIMTNWWVWSSADLVNWKKEGTLNPKNTFISKPFSDCWATFGVTKNGKYYWYFSAGREQIGVVVGNSPSGPWRDPLKKPLVPARFVPTLARDPDILMDDDGNSYMVFGTYDYFIVRLGDDMISLAEQPHPVVLDRKRGPSGWGQTDDKPSLHKRNGIYYLSWSSFYAMSTNVYGPYTYKGSVIDTNSVAPEFRSDLTTKTSLWHDRHGNFFTWHHQWYYVCNDKSQPGRDKHFRDCCLSYVHYRDNGEMAPIRLDRIGVGEYDASQPRIEAEDYFDLEHGEVRECPAGGFEVRGLQNSSFLAYPNVMNMRKNSPCALRLASATTGGAIEIRENNFNGDLLGTCKILATGDAFETVTTTLKNRAGTNNLCFIVKGRKDDSLRLDWFSLPGLKEPAH
jgi:hypothetical protein